MACGHGAKCPCVMSPSPERLSAREREHVQQWWHPQNPELVAQLVAMGFVEADCEAALKENHGDVARATEALLQRPPADEPEPEPVPAPGPEPEPQLTVEEQLRAELEECRRQLQEEQQARSDAETQRDKALARAAELERQLTARKQPAEGVPERSAH